MSTRAKRTLRYGRDQLEAARMALEDRGAEGSDSDALYGALRSLGVDPAAATRAVRYWTGCTRSNGDAAQAQDRERRARAMLVGLAIGAYLGSGEYETAAGINRSGGTRVRTRDHHPAHGDTTTRVR